MRCVLFLPALAVSLAAQDRVAFTDDLHPGSCEADGQRWVVSRVVDDVSGRPLAGAEVFLVRESETPLAGEFWFTRKATTDADGYLRVRIDDIDGKWHIQVIRHRDCGTGTRWDNGGPVWRVGRPFDVPVLVRDYRGQPAVGAKIGFCGGCGHTPDLANATTDGDGIATLRGIDPQNDIADVYVQHPGLGLGYDSIRWYPGDPPAVVDCGCSPAMTGRVVDHRGHPVAGVFVAAIDVHRGPWARTDAQGAFTLLGGKADAGPSVVQLATGRKVYFPTAARYPVTLELPDPADPDADEGTIDVAEFGSQPITTRPLEVRLVEPQELTLRVRAEYPGADGQRARGRVVDVPDEGPFALAVFPKNGQGGRPFARVYAFANRAALPPGVLTLEYFAPTRVVGRITDENGKAAAAKVRVRHRWATGGDEDEDEAAWIDCPDGTFSFDSWRSGLSLVEVLPVSSGLGPRLLWATLPLLTPDRRELDLGAVVLRATPQLRVVDDEGRPLAGATVHFARAGLQEAGEARRMRLDANGGWYGPDLVAGDAILVRLDDDAVPFRTILAGDAPWTIVPPCGALDVEIVDADGHRLDATVSFGEHAFDSRSRHALRGLPLGRLRFYVAASNCRTAIVDTTVTPRTHTMRIMLPPR